jgi:transcriptional regulator with XRE-family HTH domain
MSHRMVRRMARTTDEGLGMLVRRRRLELDLTLDELAERIGKVKSYVWGVENERRVPPDAVLRELAAALSMDEGVLIRAARWDETPAMVKREMESLRSTQESRRKLAARLIEIVRGSAVGCGRAGARRARRDVPLGGAVAAWWIGSRRRRARRRAGAGSIGAAGSTGTGGGSRELAPASSGVGGAADQQRGGGVSA